MWAGQALLPYGTQEQYKDMWILSVPSFTWIQVDQSDQSVPYGRSGHTCNIWDGQMVVVGGYVGEDISCDFPGVYTFNMSSLQWTTSFQATSDPDKNPFSQQTSQIGTNSSSGLEGSYGYIVPEPVISAVGGNGLGGATLTTPAMSATAGPLATGSPITYTVTGPDGSVITTTSIPPSGSSSDDDGPNIGAIVAGVIAGVLAVVAAYFAFCAWIYRKQLALYKRHVAVAQRASAGTMASEKDASAAAAAGMLHPPGSSSAAAAAAATAAGNAPSVASSGGGSGAPGIAAAGQVGMPPERRGRFGEQGLGGGVGGEEEDDPDDTDDLLRGLEPSFWGTRGVLLNPRRSLRVINRD
jgi:hypothetical protein